MRNMEKWSSIPYHALLKTKTPSRELSMKKEKESSMSETLQQTGRFPSSKVSLYFSLCKQVF